MTRAGEIRIGQMLEKYARYRRYIEQNRHAAKYGIQSVRVLTITETEGRAKSLCKLILETIPPKFQKYFYFATMTEFPITSPEAILGDAFIHPSDFTEGKRHQLMPAPRG